jgi:hypothetical protein
MKALITCICMTGFIHAYCQNIGIGTLTPSEKLDLNGNLNISGELKANGITGALNDVLTHNGNGTMRWAQMQQDPNGSNGGIGYGGWGGCDMANISEYNPVSNPDGMSDHYFGHSVSISGEYAIVGSPFDEGSIGEGEGSAMIFKRNSSTGVWAPHGNKLVHPSPSEGDLFGNSVSMSGDYAIVGSYSDDDAAGADQGSACIFKRNAVSGVWELQNSPLFNPSPQPGDYFGYSVSISGDYAIIGAPLDTEAAGDYQGTASVFKRNSTTGIWEVQGVKLLNGSPDINDLFGASVGISGDFAIVGAYYDAEAAGSFQGTATVFKRNTGSGIWEPQGAKLLNPGAATGDQFGFSVSISGHYAIVGSPFDAGTANQEGSATVFKRNSGSGIWEPQGGKIINPSPAFNEQFGYSVSISGDFALIGIPFNSDPLSAQGAASIYVRIGNLWRKLQDVIDPGGAIGNHFGNGVAIDANTRRFLIGAPDAQNSMGLAFFGKTQ